MDRIQINRVEDARNRSAQSLCAVRERRECKSCREMSACYRARRLGGRKGRACGHGERGVMDEVIDEL